jgi:hypothetical protein
MQFQPKKTIEIQSMKGEERRRIQAVAGRKKGRKLDSENCLWKFQSRMYIKSKTRSCTMINPGGALCSCHRHGRVCTAKGWAWFDVDNDNTET